MNLLTSREILTATGSSKLPDHVLRISRFEISGGFGCDPTRAFARCSAMLSQPDAVGEQQGSVEWKVTIVWNEGGRRCQVKDQKKEREGGAEEGTQMVEATRGARR